MTSELIAQDSLAVIRKPVLKFLLDRHTTATYLEGETARLNILLDEASSRQANLLNVIGRYKSDSIQYEKRIELAKLSADSWKKTAGECKEYYSRQLRRQRIIKWIAIGTAIGGVYLAVKN